MIRLLLATRNDGKVREVRELLANEPLRLETLAAHPEVGDVVENGKTFDENARLKAAHAARKSGLWTIGEDSGLEVDALDGAPGVRSARYAGIHGDDEANNCKLLRDLEGQMNRAARYVCVMVLAAPDGAIVATARGTCEGRILEAPRGRSGFGYDPLFVAERMDRTMAELGPEAKGAISHRGQAVRAFVPVIRSHLAKAEARSR
jgi:XTP/dITP diphosphohydrolase